MLALSIVINMTIVRVTAERNSYGTWHGRGEDRRRAAAAATPAAQNRFATAGSFTVQT